MFGTWTTPGDTPISFPSTPANRSAPHLLLPLPCRTTCELEPFVWLLRAWCMSLVTSRVPTVAFVRPICVVQVVVVVVVARVDPIVHRSSWQSTFESWWRCMCAMAVRLFVRHRHQTKPGFDGALLGRVSTRTHRFQVHQRRTARVRRRHGRAIDPRQSMNDAHAMRPRRTCTVRSNEKGDVEGATQHTWWKRHKRSKGISTREHEPTVPENARVGVWLCVEYVRITPWNLPAERPPRKKELD